MTAVTCTCATTTCFENKGEEEHDEEQRDDDIDQSKLLRESIESKIKSTVLTDTELEFVQDTLISRNTSNDDLKAMQEQLENEELFFVDARKSIEANIDGSALTETELEFVQDTLISRTVSNDNLKAMCDQLKKMSDNNLKEMNDQLENEEELLVAKNKNKTSMTNTKKNNTNNNNNEGAVHIDNNTNKNGNDALTGTASTDAATSTTTNNSNNEEGSARRQAILEARRKQEKEAVQQKAKMMWKKASAAVKLVARLGSIRTGSGKGALSLLLEDSDSDSDSDDDNDNGIDEKKEQNKKNEEKQNQKEDQSDTSGTAATSDIDHGSDDDSEDEKNENNNNKNNDNVVRMVPPPPTTTTTTTTFVYTHVDGEGFEINEEIFELPTPDEPVSSSFHDNEKVENNHAFVEEKKSADGDNDNDDDDDDDDDEDSFEENEEVNRSFSSFKFNDGNNKGSGGGGGDRRKAMMGFRQASVNMYGGGGFEVGDSNLFESIYDDNNHGGERKTDEQFDPWLFTETDEQGKKIDFKILGTSHDDAACHPHVLSPIQMIQLQPHLPTSKRGESFWLKYSLVRDGSSMVSLLRNIRGSPYTLLAIETIDGEVFGGFFTNAWQIQNGTFGTGESFVWKMKHRRTFDFHADDHASSNNDPDNSFTSLSDQAERERELEVYPSQVYYCNDYFQLCTHDKIAVGGGMCDYPIDFGTEQQEEEEEEEPQPQDDEGSSSSDSGSGADDCNNSKTSTKSTLYSPNEFGFGLCFGNGNLLTGSSSACLTYRSPPLSGIHGKGGGKFEVVNLEVWGFTPCRNEKDAKKLECKNMFFQQHSSSTRT